MLNVPVLAAHEPGVIEAGSSPLRSRCAARRQPPLIRGLTVLALAVALAACGDSITVPRRDPPTASPPAEPPPDRPQVFLTLPGEVIEHTREGARALRGFKFYLLTYGPPGL